MNTTLTEWPPRSTMVPEYPPNSQYWKVNAQNAARELLARMGREKYEAFIEYLPGGKTWREYCELLDAEVKG